MDEEKRQHRVILESSEFQRHNATLEDNRLTEFKRLQGKYSWHITNFMQLPIIWCVFGLTW